VSGVIAIIFVCEPLSGVNTAFCKLNWSKGKTTMDKDQEITQIGKRLSEIRNSLGFLQKDFAKELGISGASLSEIEAGNAKPRLEVYYNLLHKFNVSPDYWLLGKGEIFVSEEAREAGGSFEEQDHVFTGESNEFLLVFSESIKSSPIIKYSMMSHFRTFLLENETLITKDTRKHHPGLLLDIRHNPHTLSTFSE
jgi:transcriptional regulator with XRE-family HTH domain